MPTENPTTGASGLPRNLLPRDFPTGPGWWVGYYSGSGSDGGPTHETREEAIAEAMRGRDDPYNRWVKTAVLEGADGTREVIWHRE